MSKKPVYFHIDVNSAFLAWEAVWRLQHGESLDIRTIPSVVGGNQATRHGIVLAKSVPAKRLFNIKTGEPIFTVKKRAPNILVAPPRYELYERASKALMDYLKHFSPGVERFSVDEAFLEYTGLDHLHGHPEDAARRLADNIKNELGFTVNIGISTNKLLAKMAGEFEKPDKTHTLWPNEVKDKLWPLPVGELYMVGRRTEQKLNDQGIFTIGELASRDPDALRRRFKSQGILLWNFANGHYTDSGKGGAGNFQGMLPNTANSIGVKGMGNSSTIAFDVEDTPTAHQVLLSLSETVSSRLREGRLRSHVIYISYATHDFKRFSRQKKYASPTASTSDIYNRAATVFDELWDCTPIRQMCVWAGGLTHHEHMQTSFIDNTWKSELVDRAVDSLRQKFGDGAVFRGSLLRGDVRHMIGGTASNRRFPNEAIPV